MNMYSFFAVFFSVSNLQLGFVSKRIHIADRTEQNCSVSNILRTTEYCRTLSTLFTPPTRQDMIHVGGVN